MKKLAVLAMIPALLCGLATAQAATIRVATGQKGNWDTSIMDFGIKQGFFKAEGLDIQETYTAGGAATLQAVVSGSVDIGIGVGLLGVVGAYVKGAPIRVLSNETSGGADLFWYVKAGSGITSLKQAGGKTVGYSEAGSSTDLALHALLKYYGVTNARPVAAGGIPATLTQVMSGQLDIGWSAAPANLQAVQDGKLVIVAHGSDAPALTGETVRVNAVNANSYDHRKADIEKWFRAYVKSYEWAYSGDPKVIDYYAEGLKVPHALAAMAQKEYYPKAALDPFTLGKMQTVLDQAYDFKFIPKPMKPADVAGMIVIPAKQ